MSDFKIGPGRSTGPMITVTTLVSTLVLMAAGCSSSPAADLTGDPGDVGDLKGQSLDAMDTGEFELTGEMSNDRQSHAAIKLSDGRVMALGGRGKGCLLYTSPSPRD